MGVPGFVAWLYHNHKKTNFIFKHLFKQILTEQNNITNIDDVELNDSIRVETVDHLLIDTNCLIHPQSKIVCINNPNLVENNVELLEKKIIKQVIEYIKLLIDKTKPTKSIYISVDGVAPMAKIKQQRLRRFKTMYDNKMTELISKKYNKPTKKEWNNSAITPGTIFMDKLMKSILSWIKNTNFDCKVIFSSSYTPGEGEHKLLQYLKSLPQTDNDVSVIYGLDADLLFLALSSEREKLYLMRETSQMEIDNSHCNEGFSYLSIDVLRVIIRDEMVQRLTSDRMWDDKSLVNDFVFLCYFCGNDFIPNIPSLSIKPPNKKIQNGIDTIIDTYTDVMKSVNIAETKYLIQINDNKHIHINYELFLNILNALTDQEIAYYNDFFKYKRFIHFSDSRDPYEIEKYNYDTNIIDNYYDPIMLGDPLCDMNDWKYKYYKHYFGIKIDVSDHNDKSLYNVLDDYIKGIIWTTYYYYDRCKDYEWYYQYHHGPFLSDLRDFIKKYPNRLDNYEQLYGINGEWFNGQIKPLQQLMLVLPHESSFLIPSSYRNLMFDATLKKYFPNRIQDIKIDYLYKNHAWQNIPMINIIPARKVLSLSSKIILKEEAERNKVYNEYVKTK